ncbi:unnamed protein product [Lactuca saligna]|uniref:Uncharacterized protein n=1 Tax=Lactuca saligna TaxID=75948 RepID=A0AA36E2D4_LACSI|nr:unnamed protein product [Lactuca saligna]
MLNIPIRSWEAGPPVLGVSPSMKIGVSLKMTSSGWHSEDVPLSKFKILGCKNEGEVGVVSIGLLDFKLNISIVSNNILLILPCSVIRDSILVNIEMTLVLEIVWSKITQV